MKLLRNDKKARTANIGFAKCGVYDRIKPLAFYPPKAVCFCFFIKFTKRLTALATFGSELNFRSIQARTSQSHFPLCDTLFEQSYQKETNEKQKCRNIQ